MKRLCVFCGSSPGIDPAYVQGAGALGRALVSHGCGLVYGGGSRGMMGTVADAVLEAGGEAIGVVPDGLFKAESVHTGLSELKYTTTMAERKALMTDLSDGFIVLPGGVGTLDELFEVWVWNQLGIENLPCGLLNTAGYYDGLLGFLDHTVESAFVRREHRSLLMVDSKPDQLVSRLLQ